MRENAAGAKSWTKLGVSVCLGAAVTFLLLVICAVVMTVKDFPPSLAKPLASMAGGIGALVGGLTAAKKYGRKGLVYGLAVGGILFLVVTAVGFIVSPASLSVFTLLKAAVMLICGALGGVIGINSGGRRRF